jgi:hypothetical protein
MCKTESEYLRNLVEHARASQVFFNNKSKAERERSVCRAFLRAIGVPFEEQELIAPAAEPTDVSFRTARFQIRELLEPGRKRGDELKEKEKKYIEAKSMNELLEPISFPKSVNLKTFLPEIVEALTEKAQKYGAGCNAIDALVYVNIEDRYLSADSYMPMLDDLKSQKWRSASFLFPPYGVILYANPDAPDFLNKLKPGQYEEWHDIFTLFEK